MAKNWVSYFGPEILITISNLEVQPLAVCQFHQSTFWPYRRRRSNGGQRKGQNDATEYALENEKYTRHIMARSMLRTNEPSWAPKDIFVILKISGAKNLKCWPPIKKKSGRYFDLVNFLAESWIFPLFRRF